MTLSNSEIKKFTYGYPMSAITTDIVIFRNVGPIEVLLIRRKENPYRSMLALIGGHC